MVILTDCAVHCSFNLSWPNPRLRGTYESNSMREEAMKLIPHLTGLLSLNVVILPVSPFCLLASPVPCSTGMLPLQPG